MSLTKRERQFLEGKLKLEKGSEYERRLRSDIKKKLGTSFAVVCIYCERAQTEGKMLEISAGDNTVYACCDCAPQGIQSRRVIVSKEGIKPESN